MKESIKVLQECAEIQTKKSGIYKEVQALNKKMENFDD